MPDRTLAHHPPGPGTTAAALRRGTFPPGAVRTAPAAALLQRALADPRALSAGDVLQLQRTLGNRAVVGLLRPAPVPDAPAGPIRRAPGDAAIQRKYGIRQVGYWSDEARRVREERLARGSFDAGPNFASLADGTYDDVASSAGNALHSEVVLVGGAAKADGVQSNDPATLFQHYKGMKVAGRRGNARLYTERHPCHNAGIDGRGCERSLETALDDNDEVCFSVNANAELAGHLEDLLHESAQRDEQQQQQQQQQADDDSMDAEGMAVLLEQEQQEQELAAMGMDMDDVWEHRLATLHSDSTSWMEKLALVRSFPELLGRLRTLGDGELADRLAQGV